MLIGILAAVLASGGAEWAGQAPPEAAASPAPAVPAAGPDEALADAPLEAEAVPPGTPTITLAGAVTMALERNFSLLNSADAVTSSRLREGVARAQFYPKLTPRFQRSGDDTSLALEAQQRVPWTGGTVTASANLRSFSDSADLGPFPRTSDMRLTVTQPLLRGFGPNASFYDLRLSRRSRESQERQFELGRQRLAVEVARSFFQVIQQRQLLGVARQSLDRSDKLRRASESRLQVGLVSKLDVYRAELQASQAEESMVRSEASLEAELERFRTLLGLAPTEPLQPEAADLPEDLGSPIEPVEVLTQRALDHRLDLKEAVDEVGDAERTASLARQNLLPQLDLNLGVSQIGTGTTFGNAFTAADRRVSVFLSTSYPLERSSEAANRAVARLDVTARERTLHQRRLELQAEVRGAVRELERLRKSIELQKKGVEVAEQQRRLATLRYQRGLASNFDVVDAEGSLVVARSALVGLLTSYQVAKVDLMRVTGTLDVDKEFAP
ncbi:MAG TPA: TolC family protein [Vicinamibacteria bacterium]|nr:TolC family protein [Vicinamibacteria bacterium]